MIFYFFSKIVSVLEEGGYVKSGIVLEYVVHGEILIFILTMIANTIFKEYAHIC